MNTHGWKVVIIQDGFQYDSERVAIHRRVGDYTEVITGWTDDGHPILHSFPENATNDAVLPHLPRGVLDAIAEAVKPGPAQAEVNRVVENLTHERARLDLILDRIWQ